MKYIFIIYSQPQPHIGWKQYSIERDEIEDSGTVYDKEIKFEEHTWCTFMGRKFYYEIIKDQNIDFLILYDELVKMHVYSKFLMIWDENECLLYDDTNSNYIFRGYARYNPFFDSMKSFKSIEASSEKIEGKRVYSVNKLSSFKIDDAWATDKSNGIGSIVNIESWDKINTIVISNGYISYKDPSLYYKNSRVRKLEISDWYGKFSMILEILDTPNIQRFLIPIATTKLRLKILEIYPGTQYNDLCINFIKQ